MITDIPDGYHQAPRQEGFSAVIGPFYQCSHASYRGHENSMVRAFRVESRHCNPEGFLHGGMLSSFFDFVMYQALGDCLGEASITPTITMTTNFLVGAKQGDWLEGIGVVRRKTRSMMFMEAEIYVGTTLVAHGTGVYKIVSS